MSENIEDNGQQGEPEISPVEAKAREQGWVPKEDFHGDEHKWVEAGEFLRRGELFSKIESQNKELKAIKDTLAQFKDHHNKVSDAAYKKALADLKTQKKNALVEGDADLVVEIDEQLAEVKQRQVETQRAQQAPAPQEEHPEFVSFKQKNGWYDSSRPMKAWADTRGLELREGGMAPSEVLRTIEREVRQEFPARFENPNRNRPGAVESSAQRGTRTGTESYNPNEIEQKLAKQFVREGLYKNVNEYYKELQAMNG